MNRTALVVDDSMLVRHTVCRWLEQRGFAVQAACSGTEALQMLAIAHPDLIITDLLMPGMSGHELITQLKRDPHTAGIPVVVLSSKRSDLAGLGPSAQATIFKDIDILAQLQHAVSTILPAETLPA